MGVLAVVDENALARYCRLHTRWRQAEKQVEQDGQTIMVVSREGKKLAKNPAASLAAELAAHLLRLEQSFGLTPSARASLAGNAGKKPDADTSGHDYYGSAGASQA